MEIIFSHGKIEEFVDQLDRVTYSRVGKMLAALRECGYELRLPHSKSLGDGLFELRIKGDRHIRIIYVYHNGVAVLLHIFFKKTWGIPRKEIEYARNILKQYLA